MPATLSVCLSRVPSSNPFVVSDAWPCQEQGLPYNQALCTVQAYFYRHMVGLPVCNLSCEIKEVFLKIWYASVYLKVMALDYIN